jgi:hypothetical protein
MLVSNLVLLAGLEPAHVGLKTRCLNQLGYKSVKIVCQHRSRLAVQSAMLCV